ncbi:hypothetical protein D9613_001170 [Agrocybe pediades]|uniref:Uncharacterized protein n=1 Tax=Agrocybe pediades TaxID=84607 RepID=A0A8H4R1J0_9AGAR|nr:hypothetical protein D9613_001170 [Agrocybe pediades]
MPPASPPHGSSIFTEWLISTYTKFLNFLEYLRNLTSPKLKAFSTRFLPRRLHAFILQWVTCSLSHLFEALYLFIMGSIFCTEFVFGGKSGRKRMMKLYKTPVKDLINNDTVEAVPRLLSWYVWVDDIMENSELRRRYETMKCTLRSWKHAPGLHNPTPQEAAMAYRYEKRLRTLNPTPPPGYVRINFYSRPDALLPKSKEMHQCDFRDNLFCGGYAFPPVEVDAAIDLKINTTDGSIDLSIAKRKFGIASIDIIGPYGNIFKPSDDDRLSHLAVYTMSNEYKEPIRIFEPCVSKSISVARKIRWNGYSILSHLLLWFRCFIGRPEQDFMYLQLKLGRPAVLYEFIGRYTSAMHYFLSLLIMNILAILVYCFILFPARILHRCGVATTKVGTLTYKLLINASKAPGLFFDYSIVFCASVSLRAWFLSAAVCYVIYIVGLSCCVMHAEYQAGDPMMFGPSSILAYGVRTWFTAALAISFLTWITPGFA